MPEDRLDRAGQIGLGFGNRNPVSFTRAGLILPCASDSPRFLFESIRDALKSYTAISLFISRRH